MIYDKKYISDLFKLGSIRRVELVEALLKPGKWEMIVFTMYGRELHVETARGEPKAFASLEAARKFAYDIGFKEIHISW